ncbi:MAG: low temperature requirement protein A [Actinobacteria bacterium]|nr:low temperature requirement protein A [Actinomycetota bacterium]
MDRPVDEVRGVTGRAVTFLELFFDLVYVFAIIRVVGLIHADPTAGGLAKGALLLMVMWWTWSIYTWTTNWTGTASISVKLFLLAAMGATLVMGIAVPEALGEQSALFGTSLFIARVLAAGLYFTASRDHPQQRGAFMTFFPLSSLAAVLFLVGGFLGGNMVLGFILGGVAADLVGAINAGRGAWAVDASHFAERNGLFIIIALGESIVGLGIAASRTPADLPHLTALVVAFVGVATLWWAYFDEAAPYAEERMAELTGRSRRRFARDFYTLGLYPLVVGIVYFAVGLEEVVSHPGDPLGIIDRFALGAGLALALLGIALGTWRGKRFLRGEMILAGAILLSLVLIGLPVSALAFALLVVGVLVVTLIVERAEPRLA